MSKFELFVDPKLIPQLKYDVRELKRKDFIETINFLRKDKTSRPKL